MNRIGTVALKLYANSLLWFTIGVTSGSTFEAVILITYFRTGHF